MDMTDDLQVDTGGQTINIGVTQGQIDSTTLEIESTTGDLTLNGDGGELYFDDSRTVAIPFSDATYTTLPGTATSILGALHQAFEEGGDVLEREDTNVLAGADISANVLVIGSGGSANTANDLIDYWDTDAATTAQNFVDNVILFINGIYQRPGLNAAANNDVYPTTVQAEAQVGAFYCERKIKKNANIMMMYIQK